MHILLTNDDGIFADGLRAMCDAAVAVGHRVSVCAPDRERSAASHSITLAASLHARAVDYPGAAHAWQVDGTPADCASLGLYLTREDPVDMVISGINFGMNMGGACVYSGTVAAAIEAAMCGVQALAVSLCIHHREGDHDYRAAARLGVRVAEWATGHPLPLGVAYSLNVPELPYDEIKGLAPATLGPVFLTPAVYTPGEDAQGACYYYRGGPNPPLDDPKYDVNLMERGYATLTKLTWDFRLNAGDEELGTIGL